MINLKGTKINLSNLFLSLCFFCNNKTMSEKTIRYLIKEKADVNLADHNGDTPLSLAFPENLDLDLDIIKCLVEGKADVDYEDRNGDTPLSLAVVSRNLDVVKCLVEEGKADINQEDDYGTPFQQAVKIGRYTDDLSIFRYLVEAKADINKFDDCGRTPLNIMASNNFYATVVLIVYGARIPHELSNLEYVVAAVTIKERVLGLLQEKEQEIEAGLKITKLDAIESVLNK